MKEDTQIIDEYAREFERHLVGSAEDRRRRRQELIGHLSDAAEEGELTAALERLGSPEAAAVTFGKRATLPYAPVGRRIAALFIDHLPLIGVSVALAVQAIGRGQNISFAFPPWMYSEGGGMLHFIGVPAALVWSIIVLGVLEGTKGVTPGKALLGLQVVTEAGLKIHVGDGIFRRVCLLFGPFAWIDWIPIVFNERRRILEHVTHTAVVDAARLSATPADARGTGVAT